jgi:hypothetical protein
MTDKILASGLVVGVGIIVVSAIATIAYDPEVELYPGRTMPRSLAETTLAVWDSPVAGHAAKWVNSDPIIVSSEGKLGD